MTKKWDGQKSLSLKPGEVLVSVKLGTMGLWGYAMQGADRDALVVGQLVPIRELAPGAKPFKVRVDRIEVDGGFIGVSHP